MSLVVRLRLVLSALICSVNLLAGTTPVSLNLIVSAARSVYGQPIILTAYVSPGDAAGNVVFLDGVNILGTSVLGSGQAALSTNLLSSGTHAFRAQYTGDSVYATGFSAPVSQTTMSLPATSLGQLTNYTTSSTAAYVDAADFNRDGNTDLVVTTGAGIGILLGNGDGTFAPLMPFGVNPSVAVATADLNGDGLVDLAVVNHTANSVSILLGNGDGTFQSPVDFPTGQGPVSIVAADFNRDGKTDLAVAYALNNGNSGGVSELLGNGDGTFQPALDIPTPYPLSFITAGDLNHDDVADLVTTDLGGRYARIFLGNGNGSFQNPMLVGDFSNGNAIALGDLNEDGIPDLIVAGDNVIVFLGVGDGTFGPGAYYSSPASPFGVTVADFNGDSRLDVAVASPFDGVAAVLVGNGDGTLAPATYYDLPQQLAVTLATGDFNGDGVVDLAISNLAPTQNLSILLGQPPPLVQVFTDVPPSAFYFAAVNDLFKLGVTTGCGPSTFCPDQPLPRWEAAILLVRAIIGSDDFTTSPIPYFTDVSVNAPGFIWIQKLYELGITSGCGNNPSGTLQFCPNDSLSRDEASVLVIRARYGATTPFAWPLTPYFTDVSPGGYAFPHIQRLREDNITSGCSATMYCPSDLTSRAEMAVFLVRAGFNLLLPATEPLISAVSPATLTQGATGIFTVIGKNTHFVQGITQLVFSPTSGIIVSSIQVISPDSMTVALMASPTALAEPAPIYIQTGSEEAVLPNGLTVLFGHE